MGFGVLLLWERYDGGVVGLHADVLVYGVSKVPMDLSVDSLSVFLSFVYYVDDTQATAYGMHSGVSESIFFIKHLSTIPGTPFAKQRSYRLCAVCHHQTTCQDCFPLLRLSLIRPKSGA
jgi:hypothetical protein